MEDLISPGFSVNALSSPFEDATLGTKGCHLRPASFRRRPRPSNLVRAEIPPLEFAKVPRPPAASRPSTSSRSLSTPRETGTLAPNTSSATSQANGSEELLAFGNLHQAAIIDCLACDAQGNGEASGKKYVGSKVTMVDQSCQTDERAFTDQLDAIMRENYSKTKELQKMRETLRLLQAEVRQERLMSEQFRGQVDILEEQLSASLEKQRRAESERAVASWQLQNGGLRRTRSSTPGPRIAPPKDAWFEQDRQERSKCEHKRQVAHPDMKTGSQATKRDVSEDSESECESSEAESAASSDGKSVSVVFHPPPKHERTVR